MLDKVELRRRQTLHVALREPVAFRSSCCEPLHRKTVMMRARVLAVVSAVALLSSPSAEAQRAVDTIFGDIPGGLFGQDVDGIGDVNGDGVEDFIVGMPMLFKSPTPQPGRARVYSGSDRALLYEVVGNHAMDKFGEQVAGVGDLNGDGTPDFAVGAPRDNTSFPSAGLVRAYSGADGSILWTRYGEVASEHLGQALSHVGDVNGDGHCEVLVGAPRPSSGHPGRVRMYAGRSGGTLHEFQGDFADDQFGACVAGVGDCDGDSFPDFASVAPFPSLPSQSYVTVYSGATFIRLRTLLPQTDRVSVVSAIGDVDADGRDDLAVTELLGVSNSGGVFVYSGANGSVLLTVLDAQREFLGGALAEVGDVNGDSVPDLLVGAYGNDVAFPSAGAVKVLSGQTGDTLFSVFGDYDSDRIGFAVASLRGSESTPGHILVPQSGASPGGRVRLHLSNTPLGDVYCAASANSTNRPSAIFLSGVNSISANTLTLHANYVPPGQTGLFIYSPDQAQSPLGDGFLCLGSSTQGFINRLSGELSNALGIMEYALDVLSPPSPESQITPGSTWHFQAFFRDLPAGGAGFNFSDAVTVTFVP